MRKTLLTLTLTGAVLVNAPGAPIHFQSGEKHVSLVELYTSEGCSSCPPAESWLARLKDSPELWKEFAPVAFHVDYWNSLGWKDRWSSSEFTERQRAYAEAWKSDNIYTPCFVVNGKEWQGWFISRGIPAASADNVGILAVTSADTNRWNASFIPAKPSDTSYEIHASLLGSGLNSDMKAGENSERHLQHEFTVLNLMQVGMVTSNGMAKGRFISDTLRYNSEKELAITVWVTRAGQLEPLQAAGGWLVNAADAGK
jgi:hypothetical protein